MPPVNAAPPAKSAAAAKTAAPSPPPTEPAAQATTGPVHLQISAVRVKKDAEVLVEQLKGKGHPALLMDKGDGWFRVMVGPFKSGDDDESD